MSNLKDLIQSLEEESNNSENEIEVYADSLKQALKLAADEFGVDISMLDYDIAEKGNKGLFGFGRQPYKVLVRPLEPDHEFGDLNELDEKLAGTIAREEKLPANAPGSFKVRVTKNGIWLKVIPPRGKGDSVSIGDVAARIDMMKITEFDQDLVKKTVKKQSGEAVRIGEWVPNVEYDGSMHVEISDDEMKAIAHFDPPRFYGRHMDTEDVMTALKHAGVVSGINEEKINKYLDEMNYSFPLIAAEGTKSKHGNDAYVEYKVRLSNEIEFDETEEQIDFKELNLIENVVAGQVLAVKVPAEAGVQGRTVTNRVLPARSGKDTKIEYGEGTILSDDGMELTAERNGQVVMKGTKITVDEVMVIQGDVNNKTGNIVMLGSVMITGNVIDNFTVKASGNVEVRGSVQKSFIEAEGDIIVRGGINGRDGAKIETTGGSIFARFVRAAHLVAEKNVVVGEELLHSRVDAGSTIISNGRRAHIVGGILRAGDIVCAKEIGADSYARTEVRVGTDPKLLQQISDMENILQNVLDEKEQIEKDLNTLEQRQRAGKINAEQKKKMQELKSRYEKLEASEAEYKSEKEELDEYLSVIEQNGKVSAEKTLYPGVEIYIKDKKLKVNDPYSDVSVTLEQGDWKFGNYEPPPGFEQQTISNSRRR